MTDQAKTYAKELIKELDNNGIIVVERQKIQRIIKVLRGRLIDYNNTEFEEAINELEKL